MAWRSWRSASPHPVGSAIPSESPSTYGLLLGLLEPTPIRPSQLQRLLPSSGTLPQLNHPGRAGFLLRPWLTGLRSLAQVIFINNPLSGIVLLLAFLLESPRLALLAVVGTTGANLASRAFSLSRDCGMRASMASTEPWWAARQPYWGASGYRPVLGSGWSWCCSAVVPPPCSWRVGGAAFIALAPFHR